MNGFKIVVDEGGDLPQDYQKKNQIEKMIPMKYTINGIDYTGYNDPNRMTLGEFYQTLRKRQKIRINQVGISLRAFREAFEPLAQDGNDILYITFSSNLYFNHICDDANMVAIDLMEAYPGVTIRVVDSLQVSLGTGLLVHYAVELRKQGKTLEETAMILEREKQHILSYFAINDLHFVKRVGRISEMAAVVGSMLRIKPILQINQEGDLIAIGKAHGRKQVLRKLVKKMKQKINSQRNQVVFIAHGDCSKAANDVAELVKKKLNMECFLIHIIGVSTASRLGAGAVALFFWGDSRLEEQNSHSNPKLWYHDQYR